MAATSTIPAASVDEAIAEARRRSENSICNDDRIPDRQRRFEILDERHLPLEVNPEL